MIEELTSFEIKKIFGDDLKPSTYKMLYDLILDLQKQFIKLGVDNESFKAELKIIISDKVKAELEVLINTGDLQIIVSNALNDKFREIIEARKDFNSLGERLDNIDTQLDNKAYKSFVTYEDFGAIGDGVNDDGESIKLAHNYANNNNYNVLCSYGKKYLIKNTKNIIVNTNVDFNNSTIIIDENYASSEPVFKFETETVALTTEELNYLQTNINKNVNRYESLNTLNGYVVKVEDNSCIICKRELGGGVENQFYKEVFAVNNDGSILCLNYQDPISFNATLKTGTKYKIPNNILTFKNCNFVLTGDSSSLYESYHRYIHIERSNVTIENINIEVLNDTGKIQRMFFRNENTFNVVFNNIKGPDFANNTSYSSSSYLFSNMNTINSKYYNINTPVYNPNFWGCFQSFYSKNLIIKDSNISRFDSHFYGADIIVENTNFGYKAIQLQGYGNITFNNCNVYSYTFINFREDYGATWDGNIYINNCKLIFNNKDSNTTGSIIRHNNTENFDYNYDTKLPNIFIKNFSFDDNGKMENSVCIRLLNTTGKTSERYIKMSDIIDIDTVLTNKKITVINVVGDYINSKECKINVRNVNNINYPISLYLANTGFIGLSSLNNVANYYRPTITIDNCKNISIGCKNNNCSINIRNSTINRINTLENNNGVKIDKLSIDNSTFDINCNSTPTSGVPINKLVSNNTFLNNVLFKNFKINNVDNNNGNLIFYIGLFNSNKDNLIVDTTRVVINNNMVGFNNINSELKNKLKFNIL